MFKWLWERKRNASSSQDLSNNLKLTAGSLGFRSGPIGWLVLGGVVLIIAIAIGTAVTVWNFRERALDNAKRELENTSLLLARHFDRQFEDAEYLVKDIASYIQSLRIATQADYTREMSGEAIHKILNVKTSTIPYIGTLNVINDRGDLINSSQAWPAPAINIADRSSFIELKSNPGLKVNLSGPIRNRVTGIWTLFLAHKLIGPDGSFLGAITRGIEPSYFEDFFESLQLGENASITMFDSNATMLARYPHDDSSIGKQFTKHKKLQKSENGTITIKSLTSGGEDRLSSFRVLDRVHVSVFVSKPMSVVLADWREQTRFLLLIASVTVLVILLMLFLIVRQISRQHQAARQNMSLEKERLNIAVNNITQGLMLFDRAERLVVCNRRYIDMYGLSADIIKPGCLFRDVLKHRRDTGSLTGDAEQYYQNVVQDIDKATVRIIQTGDDRTIQIKNSPVPGGGWAVTHEDITDRRRAEARIEHLAHYDPLTDLPNRTLFREKLEQQVKCLASGDQFAVLYIDIDEFKSINDTLGHPIGDELLKAVSTRLRECVGSGDIVARLGGDEFAIVQTGIHGEADVTELLARIYQTIRQPYDCLGHQVSTDASIGIALAPRDGDQLDHLLKNADLAMYGAKADGRRTYRFFETAMESRMRTRHMLELDLRQIITSNGFTQGGFEVHYQPLVNLADGNISGCEALLRWNHPQRGAISPAEFIPVAEETGLINQLGEWVLATACTEAATWPDHLKLAVNISPVQFKSQTIALKVATTLASSGFSASRLELEITEAVLIRDDETALTILHQLRAMGVRIALDDFGTGYSSLSYLQRFPFDKIKIDRCFMSDIEDAGGSIVSAVVNIATARHMTTTAEGVETERQRELLRTLGCTEMQGYLFSAAKPATEIRRMLNCDKAEPEALFGFSAA